MFSQLVSGHSSCVVFKSYNQSFVVNCSADASQISQLQHIVT